MCGKFNYFGIIFKVVSVIRAASKWVNSLFLLKRKASRMNVSINEVQLNTTATGGSYRLLSRPFRISLLILQMGLKHVMTRWLILIAAHSCMHACIKIIPCWVIGSQYRTPMCYPVKSLFIVLFLQVHKVLVWPTLLLCEWKNHIWRWLVCH